MISLSDRELKAVMEVAATLPIDKRSAFLERIAANLELSGAIWVGSLPPGIGTLD